MATADRIMATRKRAGMSRAQLASAAGLNRVTIWFLETGRHVPTRRTVERIAIALRCNIAELMEGRNGARQDNGGA